MSVSIICITYKRPHFLEEAIFSVLNQTHRDWELIIINDCPYQELIYKHPNVKIFNIGEKFKTLGEKRNFAIGKCTKNYIVSLDDDDLFLPHYISSLLESVNGYDVLSQQRVWLYNNENDIKISDYPLTSAIIYKRETYSEKVLYPKENYDEVSLFYGRLLSSTGKILVKSLSVKEIGYVYRKGIDSRYSMVKSKGIDIVDQESILNNVEVEKLGKIYLNPSWKKDYVQLIGKFGDTTIRQSFKQKEKVISPDRGSPISKNLAILQTANNRWLKVKKSWEKATGFLHAINSRGVLSTIADIGGINNSLGEKVSDDVYKLRKLSCFGDGDKITECPVIRRDATNLAFCGACGCGANKLSMLEGNGYNKLYYPYLECPLKRPGFSNHENNVLSVIITALNENIDTLNATIRSIRSTSTNVEIIVVDDCSDNVVSVEDNSVRVFRNVKRLGCAPSRHFGASVSNGKYLLFTDSHMLFSKGWFEEFIRLSETNEINVAFCGVCLGLDSNHTTLENYCGRYCGARLSLYEDEENQVLEGKWIDEKDEDLYEISCMMGAIYIINKEYFFNLRGLSDLKMWGSDEPCLALKILLSGGKMLLTKRIVAGHIFRDKAPYSTGLDFLIYNKIRMAKTLLPTELCESLIKKLPHDGNFFSAMNMINSEKNTIDEYKKYYDSIFTKNIYDVCNQYNIKLL